MILILLLVKLLTVDALNNSIVDKIKFCATLNCESKITSNVCGIRKESDGYRLKIFQNECDLLKFGCAVDAQDAYGLINIEYCDQSIHDENLVQTTSTSINTRNNFSSAREQNAANLQRHCDGICMQTNATPTCGIRQDGLGYKIARFDSECGMLKHNCENKVEYAKAFLSLCDNIEANELPDGADYAEVLEKDNKLEINETFKEHSNSDKGNAEITKEVAKLKSIVGLESERKEKITNNGKSKIIPKNLVVINTPFNGNINETIDAFFEATHLTKIPISEIPLEDQVANETSRRMLLKSAGPVMVFKPWITIPKQIKEDKWHKPTLASCYHKCPEKCPDTYAPVCGVPGIVAREPSLMFQNHCYMDKAQCKMFWEAKSPTSHSSAYVESAFLFCLGDEITGLYRFLPLVRTLQHMGRLKKRGKFHYKLRNLRFFNNFLAREPNIMG